VNSSINDGRLEDNHERVFTVIAKLIYSWAKSLSAGPKEKAEISEVVMEEVNEGASGSMNDEGQSSDMKTREVFRNALRQAAPGQPEDCLKRWIIVLEKEDVYNVKDLQLLDHEIFKDMIRNRHFPAALGSALVVLRRDSSVGQFFIWRSFVFVAACLLVVIES